MLDERFIQQICASYDGRTLSGLARNLEIAPITLWRVRKGYYSLNVPYAENERSNRKIPNACFTYVSETADRVKRGNKF